jgi:hypothetical protein
MVPPGELFGSIPTWIAVYAVSAAVFALSGLVLYLRVFRLVLVGTNAGRLDRPFQRLAGAVPLIFGQRKVLQSVSLRRDRAGLAHFLIFWGFLSFLIAEQWDSIQVGLHYAEAVYPPLYYGYGEPGSFADRRRWAREWDRSLLEFAPETVLVLLRATPEAIRERMRAVPSPDGVPREDEIEKVIDLFEEQYAETELNHKLAIETSGVTVEQSVAEFARKVEPFLTEEDRRRMEGSGG